MIILEAKIIKIISLTAVVINAGSNKDVKKGQKFQIVGKTGTDPVIDPDTGENLGSLDEIKGTVIVTRVYPNMSILETPVHRKGFSPIQMPGPSGSIMNALYGPEEQVNLNVDRSQITGGMPDSSPIRIGDLVREI